MYFNKSFLRSKFINKRKKLYSKKTFFSFNKIFSLIRKNFPGKKVSIGGYYPSNFEVDILNFLEVANKKKFKISLPVIRKNYRMFFKHWTPSEPLYVNKYGILEPEKHNITLVPDIILVPLAVFDKKLNRIGYGKGYYDRFLKKSASIKKILTIGIAFSFQESAFIPTNKFDYKLDCVLTDKKLIYNKNNEDFIFR